MKKNKKTSKCLAFIKELGNSYKFRRFFPIWTCMVILLIFTPVIKTLVELKDSTMYTLHNFTQLKSKILQPNSGGEVLSSQAQEMLSLLHAHKITKYQVSPRLQRRLQNLQRITESAWPIKRDPDAFFHLLLIREIKQGSTGTEIARRKEIALVYRPSL